MSSQLIKSMIFLLSFLALFVPNALAQDEEALPEFPFEFIPDIAPDEWVQTEFIPEIFQGTWEMDKFFYRPISPLPDTPPEPYVGHIIEIGNRSVDLFGYRCNASGVHISYKDHTERDEFGFLVALRRGPFFDPNVVTDEDIEPYYPYSLDVIINCENELIPVPEGNDALFFGSDDYPDNTSVSFTVFSDEGHFLTTGYSDGPRYVLRPVGE